MRVRNLLLTVPLLVAVPAFSGAAERTLVLDPEATSISFVLDATLHTVHGRLELERGAVTFDELPGPARGEVVVDASSALTGNDKRDRKMHDDVLRSGVFPDLVLTVEEVDGELPEDGEGRLRLAGVFVVLGDRHPVELDLQVRRSGDLVAFETTFEVPYVDWGIKDPSKFVLRVGKAVTVTVSGEGRLGPAATPDRSD